MISKYVFGKTIKIATKSFFNTPNIEELMPSSACYTRNGLEYWVGDVSYKNSRETETFHFTVNVCNSNIVDVHVHDVLNLRNHNEIQFKLNNDKTTKGITLNVGIQYDSEMFYVLPDTPHKFEHAITSPEEVMDLVKSYVALYTDTVKQWYIAANNKNNELAIDYAGLTHIITDMFETAGYKTIRNEETDEFDTATKTCRFWFKLGFIHDFNFNICINPAAQHPIIFKSTDNDFLRYAVVYCIDKALDNDDEENQLHPKKLFFDSQEDLLTYLKAMLKLTKQIMDSANAIKNMCHISIQQND